MAEKGAPDERLVAAHRALREDGDIQFTLARPEPPEETPQWLKKLVEWIGEVMAPVGRFLRWVTSLMPEAPYARILLWTVIAVILLLLVRMTYVRVKDGEWRLPHRRRRSAQPVDAGPEPDEWVPDEVPARQWLREADRLASLGQFGEAIHHLLLKGVEDIGRRRPQLLRPALTSRDIAAADAIPPAPRKLFAELARAVEASLFGGSPVGADDWQRCRQAYADFTQARTWRA